MGSELRHIALLDDNPRTLWETAQILKPYYDVEQLSVSETLFQHCQEHDVNLVVMSATLVARHFVAIVADLHHHWPALPLVLTCRDDEHGRRMRENYESIATGVASRPLETASFLALIKRVLENHPYSTLKMEMTDTGRQ